MRVLKIPHTLVLASPRFAPQGLLFRRPTDFQVPLIALADGRWVYPGPARGGVGYVPYPLLGGQGVVVWPPDESTAVLDLPKTRSRNDSRTVELKAHLDDNGILKGRVADILVGGEAIAIGRYFDQLDRSEYPRLAARMLISALSSGRVQGMEPFNDPPLSGQLSVRYRFDGALDSPNRIGCFPIQPGRKFASLDRRSTPLLLAQPVDQRVRIRLTADPKMVLDQRAIDLTYGPHRFTRRVHRGWRETVITCHLRVVGGHVLPKDYPGFRDWARAVDRAEYIRITHNAEMQSPIQGAGLTNSP